MKDEPDRDDGPSITEIVYTWPDGREEVKYRRIFGSFESEKLEREVKVLQQRLGEDCPYSVRYV